MMGMKERSRDFLQKYGMHYESIDLEKDCGTFIKEMEKGLAGSGSSLEMIPTYISAEGNVPMEEPVIVIDAGGTNFRVAVVHFDRDNKPVVEDFQLYRMPGTQGEISKEEFFDTMAGYVKPVMGRSSKIGFCFSYATEIQKNKDGKLISFSKEVRVKDVIGELIGANLMEAVKKLGEAGDKSIVLLNDTVATLLSGKAASPGRVYDSYIGFILGTGTNTCYIEDAGKIGKLGGANAPEGSMLINMESGGYAAMHRGLIDIEFDNTTVNPGQYAFEKMISGAYQGGLITAVIRKAAEEGLFSGNFVKKFAEVKTLESRDIDLFLYYPYAADNVLAACCKGPQEVENDSDRLVLYYLIDGIMERAAKLVTVNLSAAILKTGKGTNPCAPVCITADGSTFYKSKLFRGKLDHYVKSFMNEQVGIYCEFIKAEHGTLTGTAIAGLIG